MDERLSLRASVFHARAAGANRHNAWTVRNGMTLARHYDDVAAEAMAARLNVAIVDISWRWRIVLEGGAAEAMLSRLVTRNPAPLAPGAALKALWLTDGGGVRGAGVVARFGRETFQLIATAADRDWLDAAAAAFGVRQSDVSTETGGLAVIGPYAGAVLKAADMSCDLAPLAFRRLTWRGLDVMVSRWGEHGGYEIWCAPEDALVVWDRLTAAGARFGLRPAGTEAVDLLDIEAGVARPFLDYRPARDGIAAAPHPAAFGLDGLIDSAHTDFNGRRALKGATRKLVGLEINADVPAPFASLSLSGRVVGHALRSAWSPALRRAIALASVDHAAAMPGTILSLELPPDMDTPRLRPASGRVRDLPFLRAPDPIDA